MRASKIVDKSLLENVNQEIKIKIKMKDVGSCLSFLTSRGLPKDIYSSSNEIINVQSHCLSVISDVPGLKQLKVSKQSQLKLLSSFIEDPYFNDNMNYLIYSKPNDQLGKTVAAFLMSKAYISQMSNNLDSNLSLPMWHIMGKHPSQELISNFQSLEIQKPSFLVVSNILDDESMDYKRSMQIRDIIENNSQAVKILVVTGNRDPLTFVNSALRISLGGALLLSKAHSITI